MRCRKVDSLIEAHVAGELESVLTQKVKEHLEVCPACRRQVGLARKVAASVERCGASEVPEHAMAALFSVLGERGSELQRQERERIRAQKRLSWQIAAGVAVVAALIELTGVADLSGTTVQLVQSALTPLTRVSEFVYSLVVSDANVAEVLKPSHIQALLAAAATVILVLAAAVVGDLLLARRTRRKYFRAAF